MSKRPRIFLAVAALIVAAIVPATLLYTRSAGASTAACGSSCTSPSVQSLGTGEVLTASGSTAGSAVEMAAASTSNSSQDWTVEAEGGVPNAVTAGVLPAKLLMNYSSGTLVEFQYAPAGSPSDECMADSYTSGGDDEWNAPNLTVELARCGITAQSLWIIDANNLTNGYVDLINAGYEAQFSYLADNTGGFNDMTSPFAEPEVLTVNSSDDVVLAPLSEIGGVVSSGQMWTAYTAPDQSALRAQIEKAK